MKRRDVPRTQTSFWVDPFEKATRRTKVLCSVMALAILIFDLVSVECTGGMGWLDMIIASRLGSKTISSSSDWTLHLMFTLN